MHSLVKNGSETPLDSKAFILLPFYSSQMFCRKSDSVLSSSCYGAEFRGTRVWTCSQLTKGWRLIGGGGGGGVGGGRGRLFQISRTKGALNRGMALIRGNTVLEHSKRWVVN